MGLLALGLLLVGGCGDRVDLAPDEAAVLVPAEDGRVQYLALGDSYTIGESVAEAERWPVQMVGMLREAGVDVADPVIIAKTGWTVSDLSGAMRTQGVQGEWDLVSLLIGVNDQYRGYNPLEYPGGFAAMLSRAIELAGRRPERVVVVSIPDWGVTPFGQSSGRAEATREKLDAYNDINRAITRAAGAKYVDVTEVSRRAADDPALTAEDGLHPSGELYRLWAEAATAAVRDELKTSTTTRPASLSEVIGR